MHGCKIHHQPDLPEDKHDFVHSSSILISSIQRVPQNQRESGTQLLHWISRNSGVGSMNWHEKQVKSPQSSLGGLQCGSERTWEKRDSEGIGLGIVAATAKGSSRNSNSEANNAAPSGSTRSLLGSTLKISVGSNQPLFPAQNSVGSPKVPFKSPHANMTAPNAHLNSLQTQRSSLTALLKSPHFKSSNNYLNSPNAQSRFPHEKGKQIRIGMEHSESYTCVTFHGPKSSTKHIYAHSSIESETLQFPVLEQHERGTRDVALLNQSYVNVPIFHSADFLSACYFCKQQLNHGNDIYMYRIYQDLQQPFKGKCDMEWSSGLQ